MVKRYLRADVVAICVELGFKTAARWDRNAMMAKLQNEITQFGGDEELKEERLNAILHEIVEARGNVEVVAKPEDLGEEPEVETPRPVEASEEAADDDDQADDDDADLDDEGDEDDDEKEPDEEQSETQDQEGQDDEEKPVKNEKKTNAKKPAAAKPAPKAEKAKPKPPAKAATNGKAEKKISRLTASAEVIRDLKKKIPVADLARMCNDYYVGRGGVGNESESTLFTKYALQAAEAFGVAEIRDGVVIRL